MRAVMDRLGCQWTPILQGERRKPLYYQEDPPPPERPRCVVLGHYESACGGCNNIGSAAQVYELVRGLVAGKTNPPIILSEGLLLSEDVKWTSQMPALAETKVLLLTTPIERCIEQVKKRREEAGNDKPLNEANTRNRVATIDRARVRLEETPVWVFRATPEKAPEVVLRWIGEATR
jgi:hypothetical protein